MLKSKWSKQLTVTTADSMNHNNTTNKRPAFYNGMKSTPAYHIIGTFWCSQLRKIVPMPCILVITHLHRRPPGNDEEPIHEVEATTGQILSSPW